MKKQIFSEKQSPTPPVIGVHIEKGDTEKTDYHFSESFRIGRDDSCQLQITDKVVSRFHAEVLFIGGQWWLRDLQSANGTFVNGGKIDKICLNDQVHIGLSDHGPAFTLIIEKGHEPNTKEENPLSLNHYKEHYLGDSGGDDIGHRTMMVRRAFAQIQQEQKRKYIGIITVAVCICLIVGSIAVYKHLQVKRQKQLAGDIFYTMKTLELEFAEFLKTARESEDPKVLKQAKRYRERYQELEKSYAQLIDGLEVYEKGISKEEQIILKVSRTFGECEINLPDGFVKEVQRYIKKWKSTSRLSNAVARAQKNGYTTRIARILMDHDLPPQFFYLALQESNFNLNATGPKTKYGIAKGMWQFIPSTAGRYGLRIGPLVKSRRPDPRDDRHHFEKSTRAAAKYLRDIYDTEAQASGLLVTASYNWGENRVIKLIREMPKNPKERNFWNILRKHRDKIPKQTYDYVFYIFSAAVIGENPQLFGFNFENPLALIKA